tara:strand:+ start:280 stop:864 length:585 start_codon:yes stop_codon:yes gene_type:complete
METTTNNIVGREDSGGNNISLYVQLHERLGTILENIEGMHEEFNKINDKMNLLDQRSKMMNENILSTNRRLDVVLESLEENVEKNCKKMAEHIDFVENVYDNVKNPLGFVCDKVKYYIGNKKKYSLTDENDNGKSNERTNLLNNVSEDYVNLDEMGKSIKELPINVKQYIDFKEVDTVENSDYGYSDSEYSDYD